MRAIDGRSGPKRRGCQAVQVAAAARFRTVHVPCLQVLEEMQAAQHAIMPGGLNHEPSLQNQPAVSVALLLKKACLPEPATVNTLPCKACA